MSVDIQNHNAGSSPKDKMCWTWSAAGENGYPHNSHQLNIKHQAVLGEEGKGQRYLQKKTQKKTQIL